MSDLSEIKLPNNQTYQFKDASLRDDFDTFTSDFSAYVSNVGDTISDISQDVDDLTARLDLTKFKSFTIPSNNGSLTLTFSSTAATRCMIICLGYSVGTKAIFLVTSNASGTVSAATAVAGSNISFTTATRKITFTNNSTASSSIAQVILFAGDVT